MAMEGRFMPLPGGRRRRLGKEQGVPAVVTPSRGDAGNNKGGQRRLPQVVGDGGNKDSKVKFSHHLSFQKRHFWPSPSWTQTSVARKSLQARISRHKEQLFIGGKVKRNSWYIASNLRGEWKSFLGMCFLRVVDGGRRPTIQLVYAKLEVAKKKIREVSPQYAYLVDQEDEVDILGNIRMESVGPTRGRLDGDDDVEFERLIQGPSHTRMGLLMMMEMGEVAMVTVVKPVEAVVAVVRQVEAVG
ncbi:hypothetical protein Taro_054834 [Colocasia esculenta]|uniref:Uncharacterized protein n=1 Tax=Colocasia esculenta TaxID=4460 RepID=A0A843XPX8_COLES|nr:hypothetical protein [Colocasia esculenta]